MKKMDIKISLIWILVLLSLSCTSQKEQLKNSFLNYKNHSIYYESHGKASKTLVFIHGWASSLVSWQKQIKAFPTYRTLAIDLPGHGKSSKNPNLNYSLELFADSIIAILNYNKIKKAFFLGHSMGFAICEIIAQKYPNYCTGLCSMDGTLFEVPSEPEKKDEWISYNKYFAESVKTQKGKTQFINMLF